MILSPEMNGTGRRHVHDAIKVSGAKYRDLLKKRLGSQSGSGPQHAQGDRPEKVQGLGLVGVRMIFPALKVL